MKITPLLSLIGLGVSGILHADTSSPKPPLLATMSQEKRDFERNDPRGVQPNYWVTFSATTQQQLDALSDEQQLRLIPSITGEDEMASFLRYALLKNIDAKENILSALCLLPRVEAVGLVPIPLPVFFVEKGITAADLRRVQARLAHSSREKVNDLGHILIDYYQKGFKDGERELIAPQAHMNHPASAGALPEGWTLYRVRSNMPFDIALPDDFVSDKNAGIPLPSKTTTSSANSRPSEQLLHCLRAHSPDGHLEVTVSNWGYVHEMGQYKGLSNVREAVLLRLGSYGSLQSAQQTARYTRYIVQNNNSIRLTYLARDAQFNDKSAMQTLTFCVDEGASLPQQLGTIDCIIEHFVPYFDRVR